VRRLLSSIVLELQLGCCKPLAHLGKFFGLARDLILNVGVRDPKLVVLLRAPFESLFELLKF
jgi:hypothetical protein